MGFTFINAKAETITEKPSFKNSFKRKRCLVPATAYYKWKQEGKNKISYYIFLKYEPLFAMAGVKDSWISKENFTINSFSIITIAANNFISSIYNIMPLIYHRNLKKWLNRDKFDF